MNLETLTNIPFSETDINILKRRRTTVTIVLLLVFLFFSGASYFIGWTGGDIFFKVFASIFPIVPIVIMIIMHISASRDFKNGTKTVFRGIITDKNQETYSENSYRKGKTTTYFYIVFDEEKVSVERYYYNKCHIGDTVEIHKTSASQTTIDVIVQNSDSRINSQNQNNFGFQNSDFENIKEEAMTEDDFAQLKKLRNKRLFFTTLIAGFLSYIAYWILILIYAFLIVRVFKVENGETIKQGHYSIYLIIAAAVIYVFYKKIYPMQNDMNLRIKTITEAVVEEKSESAVKTTENNIQITSHRGHFYYLVVHGRYYSVSQELFDTIQSGDKILISKAKNSNIFLGLEKKKK